MRLILTRKRAYLCLGLFFWIRWAMGGLLHQLESPIFINPLSDNTHWALHLLNIPQFFLSNWWAAAAVDMILCGMPLLLVKYERNRGLNLLYALAFTVYYFSFSTSITHHNHSLVGGVFLAWILVIQARVRFVIWMYWFRYYACFVLFSAGVWKLARGVAFLPEQMQHILTQQHAQFLHDAPASLYTQSLEYLIASPRLAFMLWIGGWGLELMFGIGFLTKRWDRGLICLLVIFLLGDYWLMRIYFGEFGLFLLGFLPQYSRFEPRIPNQDNRSKIER